MAFRIFKRLAELLDVDTSGAADGDALTFQSATSTWVPVTGGGGGGAPTNVDYLVGTASGSLSAEIAVGTSPGGELGGTWASPTVDATHSGSSHASVQAAAEATAAAALAGHAADTTGIHGISDTSVLETSAGAQAKVDTHVNDATAAHAATAISFTPDGSIAATTVQAAIVEVRDEAAGGGAPSTVDYLVGTASGGLSAEIVVGTSPGGELGGTWASPTVDATHSGSSHADVQAAAEATAAAALSAHVTDAADAHDASAISADSTTLVGTGTDVQAVLEELDNGIADHLADTSAAHAATAISFSPAGTIAATTVQAAIEEVASEAGGGGSGEALEKTITQTAHGLSVAEWVRLDGSGDYVLAQADSEANAEVVGVVVAVGDANTFTICTAGYVDVLSGLTAGTAYFLHPDTAGAITGTEPSDPDISKPVLIADTTTSGWVENMRGLFGGGDPPAASAISIADAGNDFTATDVEGALAELQADHEADATALSDHIADATAAHAASAISVSSATLSGTGTDVQAVFEEIDNLLDDHSARHENGGADEISIAGLDGTPTELTNHLNDTADAHDASAISFSATGGIAATDVQAAIAEVDSEKTTAAAALAAAQTEIADQKRVVEIQVSDPNTAGTALATGNGKAWFLVPALLNGHNLVAVLAGVTDVSSSGAVTVQIRNETQTADMLSTPLTVDVGERTSLTAAAAVIDTANDDVATGDFLAVDVDAAGTDVFGLIVALTFEAP